MLSPSIRLSVIEKMIDSEIFIRMTLFNSDNNNHDCLLELGDVMLHKTAVYLYGRSFIVMSIVQ